MVHKCCTKQKVRKGLWSPDEDEKLFNFLTSYAHSSWSSVPKLAGLQRCGKSCRLRWINYLRPDLRRGEFTVEEEKKIIECHRMLGNKWAQISKHLPGRTDNEIKNFWNSYVKKKLISQGLDPNTHAPKHRPQSSTSTSSSSSSLVFTVSPPHQTTSSNSPTSVMVKPKPPPIFLPFHLDDDPAHDLHRLPFNVINYSNVVNPTPLPPSSARSNHGFAINHDLFGYGQGDGFESKHDIVQDLTEPVHTARVEDEYMEGLFEVSNLLDFDSTTYNSFFGTVTSDATTSDYALWDNEVL